FLYGASNLGSVLALIAFPLVLERYLFLPTQTWVWSGGFVLLAFLVSGCAWLLWKSPVLVPAGGKGIDTAPPTKTAGNKATSAAISSSVNEKTGAAETETELGWGRRLRWLLLAFVPSSLMLGVTTYLASDIASWPLMWIIPLGIYLISFIVAFSRLP